MGATKSIWMWLHCCMHSVICWHFMWTVVLASVMQERASCWLAPLRCPLLYSQEDNLAPRISYHRKNTSFRKSWWRKSFEEIKTNRIIWNIEFLSLWYIYNTIILWITERTHWSKWCVVIVLKIVIPHDALYAANPHKSSDVAHIAWNLHIFAYAMKMAFIFRHMTTFSP